MNFVRCPIIIPLEQGLRQSSEVFLKIILVAFYLLSIRIRIKTGSQLSGYPQWYQFYLHSIRIRIKTFSAWSWRMLSLAFYLHSIAIRIKTQWSLWWCPEAVSYLHSIKIRIKTTDVLKQSLWELLFYLHSNRTRIKTVLRWRPWPDPSCSISIPLQ